VPFYPKPQWDSLQLLLRAFHLSSLITAGYHARAKCTAIMWALILAHIMDFSDSRGHFLCCRVEVELRLYFSILLRGLVVYRVHSCRIRVGAVVA